MGIIRPDIYGSILEGLRSPLSAPAYPFEIDWSHPLADGVSFLHLMRTLTPDYLARGAAPFTLMSGTIGVGPKGPALSGAKAGISAAQPNVTYTINQSAGSAMFYAAADFSSTDGSIHYPFECLYDNGGGYAAPEFTFQKYSDNNFYAGWNTSGGDTRVTASASGAWNAGDTFVAGVSWNASAATTSLWVKGKLWATRSGAINTFNTSSNLLTLGQVGPRDLGTATWSTTPNGPIYWVAFWDRALSAPEMSLLNADPYCFLKPVTSSAVFYSGSLILPPFFQRRRLV